jgi:hypothetical protein
MKNPGIAVEVKFEVQYRSDWTNNSWATEMDFPTDKEAKKYARDVTTPADTKLQAGRNRYPSKNVRIVKYTTYALPVSF